MLDEGRLYFHRPDAMAGDVQHVIDPAQYPEISVTIALCTIAREIQIGTARPFREVRLDVALVVAPYRAQHRWPRLGEREQSSTDLDALAGGIEKVRAVTGQRFRRASRLRRRDSRQWRDHDRAGLRLPPRIHNRTATPSDMLAVPHPRFRIYRLADRAEQSKAREIMLRGELVAPLHERANRRRRRVENRDAVSLADVPEPVLFGPVGRAFVHHAGRAVGERAVDEIRVPGHPTDVGRAPEDIVLLEIEDHSGRGCDSGEIAAGRVHDALWLAGGPRCVEDE